MRRLSGLSAGWRAQCVAGLLSAVLAIPLASGQQLQDIAPERAGGFVFIRSYEAPFVPPIRTSNSPRLQDLIRAGKLYLTAQDAIALALENNIDVELARYTPVLDEWNLERAEAGGPLPGVPSGSSQASSVANGEGVTGSLNASGITATGGSTTSGNAVNANISQVGPVTPTLDPVVQSTAAFSHRSYLFPFTLVAGEFNLQQNARNYSESISTGVISGGKVSLTFNDNYLNENAPTDLLNPENATTLSLSVQHNFLQGFGVALNSRNITVAKANLKVDDLNFKGEIISTVANVLDLYYGLVADYQDVKAKQSAVGVAQQFYENNKKQVAIGTMAPLDVTTAEAQVASSQQDLVVSQTTLAQQELSLKNAISRNGLADPLIAEVQIIPLDRIDVPEQDNLPPLKDLVTTALANRSDIAADKINLENARISAKGTENGVLPALVGLASGTNQGLSGTRRIVGPLRGAQGETSGSVIPPGFVACPPSVAPPGNVCEVPDPYFVGGIGNALGQMLRRDFPTERAGGYFAPTLRNRQAQADYGIGELGMRQTELENQRSVNQIAVDVSNQVIGLQQARVRYQAAVKNRILEQQLLEAEQKKFALGASTTFLVVQQQRDLATAQSNEVASLVTYSNARVTLDQTLGTTLETNHVTVQEARTGRVARGSTLPAELPNQPAAATIP
ncbi:MAG: TolC family protein [Acidobacteriaceae bacterium]|nr:TolC family protein [Acidobacteriaceae bacterium]